MDYLKDYSTLQAILNTPVQQGTGAASVYSKRFGPGAYALEEGQYPTLDEVFNGQFNQYLKAEKQDNGAFNAKYTRTNRDLGQLPAVNWYGSSTKIAPQNADLFLNLADELDRIDPNVFQYDATALPGYQGKNSSKATNYASLGIGERNALINVQPGLTQAKDTPKTWDIYKSYEFKYLHPELWGGQGIDDAATAKKAGWTDSMINQAGLR